MTVPWTLTVTVYFKFPNITPHFICSIDFFCSSRLSIRKGRDVIDVHTGRVCTLYARHDWGVRWVHPPQMKYIDVRPVRGSGKSSLHSS